MSATSNEDRLEILDDGKTVGWADVTNGRWSYSYSDLVVGTHTLTAKYQDKVSAIWSVEVAAPEDFETFDSLTGYYYTDVQLPFFSVSTKTPGSNSGSNFSGMAATNADAAFPGTSGRMLSISVMANDIDFPYRTCTVEIDFKGRYSIVALTCSVEHGAVGTTSTMKVLRDQAQNPPIANINLRDWPSRSSRVVTYGSAGASDIAKIQLQVSVPYPITGIREIIWIDNLRMIR